ncbi:type VI secretion system amidase effector protein Tae4 [Massilia terrae]|uniref:Type VI secretion system amidase effector protein Tae4 n=1 Tax=Massilia terrae TaxID=1811224 RepID=A0ABT2D0N1_9BURK|nr:type VI secretion system amidase effector protein Tae4 [Massilia terrae]MCS0659760.1 type VI secretion system amidase effector protein Tae4 [Massilia terrae]
MHYPDPANVSTDELYKWIGHEEKLQDPRWHNTCAIRVSLALLGAGIPSITSGKTTVMAGKYAGRTIDASQKRLSEWLAKEWGEPEKFGAALAFDNIGQRNGVISFYQLWGPFDNQGHIDLVAPHWKYRLLCEGYCYMQSVECWFWECD